MHHNKGKSLHKSLEARIKYVLNPAKTDSGKYVATFQCAAETADAEWALAHRQYRDRTHRKSDQGVIAYQVRQSFAPGEVMPEEANQIGVEFAHRFLKDKYSFIVATHVDCDHIHNHILWNAISLDGDRKFRDFYLSGQASRQLSDQICVEHQLSVIANPKHRGLDYGSWLGILKPKSQRELLREAIESAIQNDPRSLDDLLIVLEQAGWDVKRGKHISLRHEGFARYARLDTLGDGYDENSLRAVIAGKQKNPKTKNKPCVIRDQRIGLLIDIRAAMDSGKGPGFEYWAKKENLKRAAKSVRMLEARGALSSADIATVISSAQQNEAVSLEQCHEIDDQIQNLRELRQHIFSYSRTRKVAEAYRTSGYSKQFAAEHKEELRCYREAKKAFDRFGKNQLPKISELQEQEHELIIEKQKRYAAYRRTKAESKHLQEAQANVERILNHQMMITSQERSFVNQQNAKNL